MRRCSKVFGSIRWLTPGLHDRCSVNNDPAFRTHVQYHEPLRIFTQLFYQVNVVEHAFRVIDIIIGYVLQIFSGQHT